MSKQIPENDLLTVDKVLKTFSISREEWRKLSKISKVFIQGKVSEFVNKEAQKIDEILLGKSKKIAYEKVSKAIDILEIESSMKLYNDLRKAFDSARHIQSQNTYRLIVIYASILIYLVLFFTGGEELIDGFFKKQ